MCRADWSTWGFYIFLRFQVCAVSRPDRFSIPNEKTMKFAQKIVNLLYKKNIVVSCYNTVHFSFNSSFQKVGFLSRLKKGGSSAAVDEAAKCDYLKAPVKITEITIWIIFDELP